MRRLPWIIAHRGASHRAPENTLPAFELAWEEGADGVEADFRRTLDGEIVCIHDATTGRTAGADHSVAGSSLEELRSLDVGRWKGDGWKGVVLPTGAEVLRALPDGKMLFAELKGGGGLLEPFGSLLAGTGRDPALIRLLSFDPVIVAEAVRLMPAFRVCWLVDYPWNRATRSWSPTRTGILATLRRTGCAGLALSARRKLDRWFVDRLREEGMEIHVWTVDDPARALDLARLEVDSIITNRPGLIRQAVEGMHLL